MTTIQVLLSQDDFTINYAFYLFKGVGEGG